MKHVSPFGVFKAVAWRCNEEKGAAVVLVKAYRRYRRRQAIIDRLELDRAAASIQAAARTYVARKSVALWWITSRRLALREQARMRRVTEVQRTELELNRELNAAQTMQRCLRKFLAKRRYWALVRTRAADRIRRAWRGAIDRAKADLKWMHHFILRPQALIRGAASRRRSSRKTEETQRAASTIARYYRGLAGRSAKSSLLNERETIELQRHFLKLLAADGIRLKELANKKKYKDTHDIKKGKSLLLASTVTNLEASYSALKFNFEQSSPRSASSHVDSARMIEDQRHQITKAKRNFLFNNLLRLTRHSEGARKQLLDENQKQFRARQADRARDLEIEAFLRREAAPRAALDGKHNALRSAEEKQKWQVTRFSDKATCPHVLHHMWR